MSIWCQAPRTTSDAGKHRKRATVHRNGSSNTTSCYPDHPTTPHHTYRAGRTTSELGRRPCPPVGCDRRARQPQVGHGRHDRIRDPLQQAALPDLARRRRWRPVARWASKHWRASDDPIGSVGLAGGLRGGEGGGGGERRRGAAAGAAAGAGTIALQQIAQQMSLSGSAQKVVPVAPEWPAQTCRGR